MQKKTTLDKIYLKSKRPSVLSCIQVLCFWLQRQAGLGSAPEEQRLFVLSFKTDEIHLMFFLPSVRWI